MKISVATGLLVIVAVLVGIFLVTVIAVELRGDQAHGDTEEQQDLEYRGYHWPHTASIDFCEKNYGVSHFVVEFQNTVSSLAICGISMYGYEYMVHQHYRETFFLLFVTGLGSTCFHATMWRVGQALDEVGMMGVILNMLAIQHDHPSAQVVAAFAFFLSCLLYFGVSENPALFQIMFIICVVVLVVRTIQLTRQPLGKEAQSLLLRAFLVFSASASLWLAEPHVCHWSFPIQFHSIWHVGSALGCALWLQLASIVYSSTPASKQQLV